MEHLPPSEDVSIAQRQHDIKRMQRNATLLLVAVTLIFLATFAIQSAFFPQGAPWPLLLLRAFADAAMIGGIADWFAVVALFRHPLGLPIPHTAIIPRKHARIAATIGKFVADNLLASTALAQRLEELNPAKRLATWLQHEQTIALIANRTARFLPPTLETIGENRLRNSVGTALRKGIDTAITPHRLSSILSFATSQRYHQSLLDMALRATHDFINQHQDYIRARVSERCGEWVPLWVENKLANSVIDGIDGALNELANPNHPQRTEIDAKLHLYIQQMGASPEFQEQLAAMKLQLLDDPAIESYLVQAWDDVYAQLSQGSDYLESLIAQLLTDLAYRLNTDPMLQQSLNSWLRHTLEKVLLPQREFIGSLITDLINRWRTQSLVDRLENHVGQDLQYIRINGTLVGGLAGTLIQALLLALTGFSL